MKFKKILSEIERKDMPQVKGKDIPSMFKIFDDNGIEYKKGKLIVGNLQPTQEDGIQSKVDSIVLDLKSGKKFPPIVVSMDGYIMDGHHRWLAYKKEYGNNYSIDVIMIMLPKMKALKMFDAIADKVK